LQAHAARGAVLATDAAGALPLASQLTTIDLLGLSDVHIAHHNVPNLGSGPAGHEKSDPTYVFNQAPTYISTWLDPDGEPGRGFRRLPAFHDRYKLVALTRVDTSRVTEENVLSFGSEPSYPEIVALSEGRGRVPGLYRWALYQRREDGSVRTFRNDEFRSNLPDFRPSTDYVVFARAGHVPAHIMWGPFASLTPGKYVGKIHMNVGKTEADPRQRLCSLDVFDGKASLSETPMSVGALAGQTSDVSFKFDVDSAGADKKYEFRMYCWGLADVKVISVSLSRE